MSIKSSVLYLVLYERATNSEQRGRVQMSRLNANGGGGKRRHLCAQIGAHIAARARRGAVARVRGERRPRQRSLLFIFLVADRRMLIVRARKAEKTCFLIVVVFCLINAQERPLLQLQRASYL